jgi:RNA polymerase primary sigma factor
MTPDEVVNAMQYSRRHSSLDTPFQDGEDNSLMDVLEDTQDVNPDDMLMRESMKDDVMASLDTLAGRERSVIEMYYGINRESALTLNEIGEEFSLTRERVRQIKAKAIQRLGHKSRSKMLRKYLG